MRLEGLTSMSMIDRLNEIAWKDFDPKTQSFKPHNFGEEGEQVYIRPLNAHAVTKKVTAMAENEMGLEGDETVARVDFLKALTAALRTTIAERAAIGLETDLSQVIEIAFGADSGMCNITGTGEINNVLPIIFKFPGLAISWQRPDDCHMFCLGNYNDSHASILKMLDPTTLKLIRELETSGFQFEGKTVRVVKEYVADAKGLNAAAELQPHSGSRSCNRCEQPRTEYGTRAGLVLRTKVRNALLAHHESARGKKCPICNITITRDVIEQAKADYADSNKRSAHASKHVGIYPSLDHIFDVDPNLQLIDVLHAKLNTLDARVTSLLGTDLSNTRARQIFSLLSARGIHFSHNPQVSSYSEVRARKKKCVLVCDSNREGGVGCPLHNPSC